jgi:hypothetical protein
MTRSLYENVDLERYRRHHYSMQQWDQRNTALEMSHAERLQIRSAPTCRPERVSSDNEQDSRDGSSQNRRQRIAVAVSISRSDITFAVRPYSTLACHSGTWTIKELTFTQPSARGVASARSSAVEIQAMAWDVRTAEMLDQRHVTFFG